MRQHVNPLSRCFQLPLELASLSELFERPDQPLHLDIGSARGQFLLDLASLQPYQNHLGVEIRRQLVCKAEAERKNRGDKNVRFVFCNANIGLDQWLAALPRDQLRLVTIHFPDPWFKQRHRKRRVLQPKLLLALAATLCPGRELFLQSDVFPLIKAMAALVELSGCFTRLPVRAKSWCVDNPLPVRTERERYAIARGLPVYRVLFQRCDQPLPKLEILENAQQRIDNTANSDDVFITI